MSQYHPVNSTGYSTGIEKLDRVVEMFLIGQQCDPDGGPILNNDPQYEVSFASAIVWVRCGYTTKGLLSTGRNGRDKRIKVDDYQIHDSKESVHSILTLAKIDINDMYPIETIFDGNTFTDAALNNLYFRMACWQLWIHKDYCIHHLPFEIYSQCDDISVINIMVD